MHPRNSIWFRFFLSAGLLLQVAGSLPLAGAAAEAARLPAAAPAAYAGGAAEVLGFFATDDASLQAPEASSATDGQPQPGSPAAPPLPPAGPYYQTAAAPNQPDTNVGGTIITDTTWTVANSPYTATTSVTVA